MSCTGKEWKTEVLLSSIGELVEGISGDHMPTDELHGRVALRGLLPQDGAGEH